MEKLDFAELHKEKLALVFENIDILGAMKESDTQLPPRFFKEITDDVIFDYKAKIGILNKNTKFVTKELIKDFRQLRRENGENERAKRSFTFCPPIFCTRNPRATHGRRQPPVCAGGLSITSPPRNTVTLFFLRGLYG